MSTTIKRFVLMMLLMNIPQYLILYLTNWQPCFWSLGVAAGMILDGYLDWKQRSDVRRIAIEMGLIKEHNEIIKTRNTKIVVVDFNKK